MAGVQGDQLELVAPGPADRVAVARDRPQHPAAAGDRRRPRALHAGLGRGRRQAVPRRVGPHVLGHHRLARPGGQAHRPAPGADGQLGRGRQERLGQPHGGRPAQHRPARPVLDQVDAQLLLADRGGHGRDDQGQRGRRFHLRQLLDQAAQAAELAAGGRVDLDAELQRHHVVGVDLERRHLGHHLALAEHDDAVGQVEHLVQLVGDEQDRRARPPQVAHGVEQHLGLGLAQRRRRLVEHDQPGVAVERPGHGDGLALPARQRRHRPGQVRDRDVEPGQHPPGLGVHLGPVEHDLGPLPAEEQVGDRVEVVAQRQVLPHHGHAGVGRGVGARAERPTVDPHLALVGIEDPPDALDQRRLAGTVVADQRHHLAGRHGERHAPQHLQVAEPLADRPHVEAGRGHAGALDPGPRLAAGQAAATVQVRRHGTSVPIRRRSGRLAGWMPAGCRSGFPPRPAGSGVP